MTDITQQVAENNIAAARDAPMDKWQDISTAPRDGTEILAYGINEWGHTPQGFYNVVEYWLWDEEAEEHLWRCGDSICSYLYWTPLPQPPIQLTKEPTNA